MSRPPFTMDTNLKSTTSPLNAPFIDAYLETKKAGELHGIGNAVIKTAKKYGINASYIVAHAALESAWGSSRIAHEKNNLFGWSAFDDSPYDSATGFPSRDACIDFVMGRIDELYLTVGGKYFRKSPCLGRKGTGGYGMNVKYASDPDWGQKIARIAEAMEAACEKTAPAVKLTASEAEDAGLLTVSTLLARARSAAGLPIPYVLGGGGMKPSALLPGTKSGGCDCSGYVCWCLGISRETDHALYVKLNSGWINTNAMVYDATTSTGFFTRIEKPKVGCIVVYPSKKSVRAYGHVGIVTGVGNGTMTRVIHCSSSNPVGHSIAETGPERFNKPDAIFTWYDGIL